MGSRQESPSSSSTNFYFRFDHQPNQPLKMQLLHALLLGTLVAFVAAIPIDNGVEGEAEISCGPTSITINFNTRNAWEGKLYVKEQFSTGAPCVVAGDGNGRLGSIELGFDQCGVVRERSVGGEFWEEIFHADCSNLKKMLEPRGVYVWVTVVMSFHPTFITKVDRVVRAQCFYMEADKTVSTEIEVSPLTSALATFNVPMPVCSYTIRQSSELTSDPVAFALVGQAVWHHWVCETDYRDTFCSYPYSCVVSDGQQDEIVLLNEDGCAQDKFLLGNVEYAGDLWARKESHVFKYADRANLYFNCQMRVTIKEPGQECPVPQCGPEPRRKRSTHGDSSRSDLIADVSVPRPILVADLDLNEADIPAELLQQSTRSYVREFNPFELDSVVEEDEDELCLSTSGVFVLVVALLLLAVTVTASLLMLVNKRQQ